MRDKHKGKYNMSKLARQLTLATAITVGAGPY